MEKLDLTKKYKTYFIAKTTPEIIEVAPAQFVSITGQGDPAEKPFANKIEALYSTAYTLKFAFKSKNRDFVVSKLEGLWWYDEEKYPGKTMETAIDIPRNEWKYRLLIRVPEYVNEDDLAGAIQTVIDRKHIDLAKEVEFYRMHEGRSVQMLHIGPFSTEIETLRKMNKFMTENYFKKNGLHHEIYLSDFRRTEPAKLKTILREPVK